MNRQQKYPDTECFSFYNANPYNRYGSDCVIRAISTALNQTWEQTCKELTDISLKTGYVINDRHCYEHYLKEKGWFKNKQPRKSDNTKLRGYEFCRDLRVLGYPNTNIIARVGSHHLVAIVNCKFIDIWDSSYECVGNFWSRHYIDIY